MQYPDRKYQAHRSSFRQMNAGLLAALVYALPLLASLAKLLMIPIVYFAWALTLFIFIKEKQSALVRFHSLQASMVLFLLALVVLAAGIWSGDILQMGARYAFMPAFSSRLLLPTLLLKLPAYALAGLASYSAAKKALLNEEFSLPLIGLMTHRILFHLRR